MKVDNKKIIVRLSESAEQLLELHTFHEHKTITAVVNEAIENYLLKMFASECIKNLSTSGLKAMGEMMNRKNGLIDESLNFYEWLANEKEMEAKA